VLDLILTLFNSLLFGLRGRTAMQAEIIALRHQLAVMQRTQKPHCRGRCKNPQSAGLKFPTP
jgi:hypothetical protein